MMPIAVIIIGLGVLWGKILEPASRKEAAGICLGLAGFILVPESLPQGFGTIGRSLSEGLRLLFTASLFFSLLMLGMRRSRRLQLLPLLSRSSAVLAVLMGLASFGVTSGTALWMVTSGSVLLLAGWLTATGFLAISCIKEFKKGSTPGWPLVLPLFLVLPALWPLLNTARVNLPAAVFEWLCSAELAVAALLLSFKRSSGPAWNDTADVTPSIRIAHSGIQLLNHSFKNKLLTMEMSSAPSKKNCPNPIPSDWSWR